MNYNQVIYECSPAVINSILGDFFLVCRVAAQIRSFLKACKFPMADCYSVESVESANTRVTVLAYYLSRKLALFL